MDKKFYIDQDKFYAGQIRKLMSKRHQLRKDYLKENRQFQDGEKVVVFPREGSRSQIVFVKRAFISFTNEIKYKFFKCKKDGTPSKIEAHIYSVSKIEKYEDQA